MVEKKYPLFVWLKGKLGLIIIIFIALFSRLLFVSTSLWHNDAVDFIRSATYFAVKNQYLPAHAPDYPLWNLMLGGLEKLSILFTDNIDPILLPNFFTALLGCVTIISFYYFVKILFNSNKIAFISSLIFILQPTFWLYTEITLSDGPSLLFVILALLFFNLYLVKKQNRYIYLTSLFLSLCPLIKIINILFIILLSISYLIFIKIKKDKIKLFVLLQYLIVIPIMINILIYGAIHNWQWQDILGVSRRISPSINDIISTLKIAITKSISLVFIFYLMGVFQAIKKKLHYFLSIILLPVILFVFYYSGWWKNANFDIERYLMVIAPFISLGAGYFLYSLIQRLNKQKLYIFYSITCVISIIYAVIVILSLTSFKYCDYINNKNNIAIIYPSSIYCQINKIHNQNDEKMILYSALNKIIITGSTIFISENEWSYPRYFSNNFGLGNNHFAVFNKNDNEKNIELINQNKRVSSGKIYILSDAMPNKQLHQKILEQNYVIKYITLSDKIMVMIIE